MRKRFVNRFSEDEEGCMLFEQSKILKEPSRWLRDTLYPQKLTLTSLTSGGHSVCV
jgi:hypothetical protein